jgi:two-component system chemotaxis response regulator CheY
MRSMLKEILKESKDFAVAGEAESGKQAVDRYIELKPDMVTMDIVMPDMNGIDAMKKILEIDPGANIIICSVLGQESLVMESVLAGARDFIIKPFTKEKVIKILQGATQHKV